MKGKLVIATLGIGLFLGHFARAEEMAPVELSIQVVVDRVPKPLKPFPVSKHEEVFGKTVENPYLRVDPMTRGLADVLIWTFDARRLPVKERTTRRVTFERGNYCPFVQAASRGDLLYYENKHPIADNFVSEFGDGVIITGRSTEKPYVLDKRVDKPIRSYSSVYPWPSAYVFVEEKSCCVVTDLRGEAKLRHAGWLHLQRPVELRCWHPHFGYLDVKSAEPSTEFLPHGHVRLLADSVKNKPLKIVVNAGEG